MQIKVATTYISLNFVSNLWSMHELSMHNIICSYGLISLLHRLLYMWYTSTYRLLFNACIMSIGSHTIIDDVNARHRMIRTWKAVTHSNIAVSYVIANFFRYQFCCSSWWWVHEEILLIAYHMIMMYSQNFKRCVDVNKRCTFNLPLLKTLKHCDP